ncbi:hypothetical protein [uncultured Draconibacterium sp.]|uniref:hypothetical protein n=1 Tax=uncultured Draconibacterium sp. TaxID=1573823 RepID=UPI0025D72B13|nr:hypothetical protein [uncultured Draconibacterium sp.]
MKRNLVIILLVLAAAVAGFLYFTKNDQVFTKESSLYKAVPLTSPVFLEANALKALPAENPVIQELAGVGEFNRLLNKIQFIQNVIKNEAEIQNNFSNRPFVLALDFVGKNVLYPVVISTLKNAKERQGLELLIEKLTGIPQTTFQKRNYNGYTIVDVPNATGTNVLSYSVAGNLVIISPEVILVEKCIRQLNVPGISENKYFKLVNKTVASQSDVSWYINHRRFPELWANFLNAKTKKVVNEFGETERINYKRDVLDIKNYASWSELDLSFYNERLTLSGITAADDSLNHFLSVLEGQEAVSCNSDRVLPKNTSFYLAFSFSDRDLFFQNLEEYFVHAEAYYVREEQLKMMERNFRTDSRESLRNLVKDRVIAAVTTVPAQNEKTTLFLVNNPSRNDNREQFENLLKNYAKRKAIEFSSLTSTCATGEGQTYRIYTFPYPSLPGIWLGGAFEFTQARFAAFRDDWLVFASSKNGLERYLNDLDSGMNLKADADYGIINKSAENKANLTAYANVNNIYPIRHELFSSELNKGLEKNEEVFRKFNAISWQVVCENNVYFNSVQLAYQLKPKKDVRARWQCNLGAQVTGKPQIVVNHRNKAEKEIIVQDENNRLHLITADGKIVWSIPISGKIIGEIQQVDYYNNGRLQYLFNTNEKIYLLDRTGSKVANFPIVLKANASNRVSVFDYDNNNRYRYFIACNDKKVYAYNHEGNIISGWKFGKTSGLITNPVHHFRVNNKDYIVFKDNAKVYIQNRRGETRVNAPANYTPSANDVTLNTDGIAKIVDSSKDGDVYYLFFDGKYAKKETSKLSSEHEFKVADINGNGKPEFVFADKNRLYVYTESGEKLVEEKYDNDIHGINTYANSATKKLIGFCDADANELFLLESSGKVYPGFPLTGNTELSIGKIRNGGPLSLVAGNEDGDLVCYDLE